MVWGWTPQRWEQQYFERYVPDKLARGQVPRTQPDHRAKVERLAANQGYGDVFEAEVGTALDLRTDRGWAIRSHYRSDQGNRFHDHAVDFGERFRASIEAKGGTTADSRAVRQLEKDEVVLRRRGVVVWVVEDLAKLPPTALERARELERDYPNTFLLRVVTPDTREQVFEELRELLRSKELDHFTQRQLDLADDLALARDDHAQALEAVRRAAGELGYDPQRDRWTRKLRAAERARYGELTQAATAAHAREQALAQELSAVKRIRGDIEHDLKVVRAQRADRQRLDQAVERAVRAHEHDVRDTTTVLEAITTERAQIPAELEQLRGHQHDLDTAITTHLDQQRPAGPELDLLVEQRTYAAGQARLLAHHDRELAVHEQLLTAHRENLREPPTRTQVEAELETHARHERANTPQYLRPRPVDRAVAERAATAVIQGRERLIAFEQWHHDELDRIQAPGTRTLTVEPAATVAQTRTRLLVAHRDTRDQRRARTHDLDVTSNGRVVLTGHDLTARRAALLGTDPTTRAPEPRRARTVADIGVTTPPVRVPGIAVTRAAFERDEPTRYRDRDR